MAESALENLVSSVGKGVAETPKPEVTPESTPVDKGTSITTQEPKPEPQKAEETVTPKAEDTKVSEPKAEEQKVEPKPGEEVKTEAKPEGEKVVEKPIDWGSKDYLDKQSKNGEDTFKYKELYEDMGKALNLQPNPDSDIILKEIESLKTKVVSTDNIFANDSLRQANEIAKNKGDWEEYLGLTTMSIDSHSDEDLIRLKMQENGNSEEVVNDYLEEHKDTAGQKKEAAEIRQSLKYTRDQRTKDLADKAQADNDERSKQSWEANERLKKVINEATDINGFKIDDDAKARILDIATGTTTIDGKKVSKLFAHFLYNEKGELDPQKTLNTIFRAEFFEGVTEYLKGEGKTEGKREAMEVLQNVDLGTTPTAPIEEKPEELSGLGAMNRAAKEKGLKPLQAMHA